MINLPKFFKDNQKLFGLVTISVIVIIILWGIQYYLNKKENLDVGVFPDSGVIEEPKDNVSPDPMSAPFDGSPVTDFTNKSDITPLDLLPVSNEASAFDSQFPASNGDLTSKNFLTAGYNVGINTVASSLRNANLQLRSDPFIPVQSAGPWNQSTMVPDINRKPLDIGTSSC